MALQRRVGAGGPGGGPPADPGQDGFRAFWPALWEFCTATVWPGTSEPRLTGSMLVFYQDGLVKVRLQDNERDEVAFWAGTGFSEALDRVEADLVAGRGDWRKNRYDGRRQGSRR